MKPSLFVLSLLAGLSVLLFLNEPVGAQVLSGRGKLIDLATVRPTDRVTGVIDESSRVARTGNVHPMARSEFDQGPAPGETRMDRMLLVLQPSAVQQEALEALLEAQQDPQSPEYHQWLNPESFGKMFGVSGRDVERVVDWLESHGLQVEPVSSARREVVFSGTAAQVQTAFHTEVHRYNVRGEQHYANATDPEIPQALADVVGGVLSLHNFYSKPMHAALRPLGTPAPEYTSGSSHYLAPADFATIYDAASLYTQSINGTGQSIAVVARSDYSSSDVPLFRSQFGLPVNNPKVIVNGPDPGIVSSDEQSEATLDVEWSGAVAPLATINFVVSESTNSSDGVALSAQYIVNKNVAPVVTLSFGLCEAALGTSGNQFWNGLWQQAASQGMSVFVASGDNGAAGCDAASETSASDGQAVNGLCSSPYSTCVGGTEFEDTQSPSTYWSANSNPTTFESALSYIPEAVWNESGNVAGGSELWAGGGGASQTYAKPSWQTGPGVPSDGHRDVPDVSLTAAVHDGYLIAMNNQYYLIGGTSAATPSFAGLMALVEQKTQAPEGNVNSALYALAAKQANGGAAIFHDVTTGNNSVPGQTGFTAAKNYDQASGLGSVDASVLANHWGDASTPVPGLQLSAPTTASVAQGKSTSATISTSASGGFNSKVTFSTSGAPSGLTASISPASVAAPGSGSVTLNLTASSTLAPGSYSVKVSASGGGLTQTATVGVTVCTYTLSGTSASATAAGGSFTDNVTTQAGCSWSATSSVSWITLANGATVTGNGSVGYTVSSNSSLSSRSGTVTIAGKTLTVSQAAGTAVFSLNTTSASFSAAAGTGSVTVSATPSGATWKATSSVSWITITAGASGTGSGTVSYKVASNTGPARTGTLTIAGITFTVSQSGPAASANCSSQVSVGTFTAAPNGYVGSVAVTTGPGCTWTASSNAPWLTITSGASGSGSGTVSFLALFNTAASQRSGTISVAGWGVSITEQPGQ